MGACMSADKGADSSSSEAHRHRQRENEAVRKGPPVLLYFEFQEGGSERYEIRVRPHDPVESWRKQLLECCAHELEDGVVPSELLLSFAGVTIEAQRSIADYDVEDGATLRLKVDDEALQARLALEEVQKLGPISCTCTKIIFSGNSRLLRLPTGEQLVTDSVLGHTLSTALP